MSLKHKGPQARDRAIQAAFDAFPVAALGFANLILHLPRLVGTHSEKLLALADHHERIVDVLQKAACPWRPGAPVTLAPFALAGYYCGQMLEIVSRPPHRPTERFIDRAYEGQEVLMHGRWDEVAREMLTEAKDRAAWHWNCGAAAGHLELLASTPYVFLARVRHCANPRCAGPYFLRRSGPLEPRYCRRRHCRADYREASEE